MSESVYLGKSTVCSDGRIWIPILVARNIDLKIGSELDWFAEGKRIYIEKTK